MIYPFTISSEPSLSDVGGKGLSLIKMTLAGLPVPPGFICGVSFFAPWLTSLQASPEWQAVQRNKVAGGTGFNQTDVVGTVLGTAQHGVPVQDAVYFRNQDSTMMHVLVDTEIRFLHPGHDVFNVADNG